MGKHKRSLVLIHYEQICPDLTTYTGEGGPKYNLNFCWSHFDNTFYHILVLYLKFFSLFFSSPFFIYSPLRRPY